MCEYIIIIITISYIRTNGAFYFQKYVHGKLNKILNLFKKKCFVVCVISV